MTIRDVARHLNIGWDLVKEIPKRDLTRRYAKPKLKHLRALAIDEIAVAKGHRYLTVVMDLESGAVVFVGAARGHPSSRSGSGSAQRGQDPSGGHGHVGRVSGSGPLNLPKAKIVFDHFHVIKLFNEKLSNLRRALYQATDVEHKEVLKGTRWLLLKNAENLDEKK